ncbi:MAG: hypothetical protein H6832_14720 [Planctomycetes bacterium]|nr:hypothetical protein [Planctomycetota bacterium]
MRPCSARGFRLVPDSPRKLGLIFVLPIALALASCQEGGLDKSVASEVKIAVDHHLSRLGGAPSFGTFPVAPNASWCDLQTLHFEDDGQYSTSSPGNSTSAKNPYFLGKTGELTLTDKVNRNVTLRYSGYYDLDGDAYWFLIRSNISENLLFGVRQISGKPTVADDWHVFGETLIFAKTTDAQVPENIGRAFVGEAKIDGSGAITSGVVKDSRDKSILLAGLLSGGTLGFTDFAIEFKGEDTRSYTGGIAKHVGVLVDKTWDDGEIGTLVMVRKQTASADITRLIGTWRVGLHAIFNKPGRAGVATSSGVLLLETGKTWRLSFTDSKTVLSGTFDVGDNGAFTLVENGGFNQRFEGAVDPDYRTLTFVDKTVENSADPFVALYFGIMEKKV